MVRGEEEGEGRREEEEGEGEGVMAYAGIIIGKQ